MRPREARIYFRNDSFIGDGGYFLQPFCIIPYKRYPTMPFAKKLFNFAHSSTRMVIENAFEMLKSRFRLLGKQVNFKTTEVDAHAIVAAMTIHNICIILNDEIEFESRAPTEIPTNNAAFLALHQWQDPKEGKLPDHLCVHFGEILCSFKASKISM